MSDTDRRVDSSIWPFRSELSARLRERRAEVEQAVLARVYAVADPTGSEDPSYVVGLREAVGVALDYGITAIETGSGRREPVPTHLIVQARGAARNDVSLDIVLRRYAVGYSLLADFVIQEASAGDLPQGPALREALRAIAAVFDRVVAVVAQAYTEETESRFKTEESRQAERVKRLLAGELIDGGDLGYEFDAWHLAAIAAGPGAIESLRDLSGALGRSLLLARPEPEVVWAWLGGRRRLSTRESLQLAERTLPTQVSLAFGEPGRGVKGWRLSHRQAKAAMSVALRTDSSPVSYTDVALLAAALSDEVLASSLRSTYLAPLETERDGGTALRETLRAYFATGHNVSSAAASLGISRQTAKSRLRGVEEKLRRPLDSCSAELETALRLLDLDASTRRRGLT